MKITEESVITFHASLGFVGANNVEKIETEFLNLESSTLLDNLQNNLEEWVDEQVNYEIEINRDNKVAIFIASNGFVGADVNHEEDLTYHFDEDDIEDMSDDEIRNELNEQAEDWVHDQISCWIEVDGVPLEI